MRNCTFLFMFLGLCTSPIALSGCSMMPWNHAQASNTTYLMTTEEETTAPSATLAQGSAMTLSKKVASADPDSNTTTRAALKVDNGILLQDGREGYIVMPGKGPVEPDPAYADARELKLKMRELADQLVAHLPAAYSGFIAVPTTFVEQEDFTRTSSFGRFVSEEMLYELNQRGVRTREYRINGKLTTNAQGEFVLLRSDSANQLDQNSLYIVGTYYRGNGNLFLHARLITSTGDVIRSGQSILATNALTRGMLARSGKMMTECATEIRAAKDVASSSTGAFEFGKDIH